MNDLRNLLDDLAGDPTHPTAREVDADLQRGRRALRRRRSRLAAGSLAAVGVLSVIGVFGQAQSLDAISEVTVQPARPTTASGPTPSPYVSPGSPVVAIPKTGSDTLMVQLVPAGWAVTRAEADLLEITPRDPSSAPGKLVIEVGAKGVTLPVRHDATSVIFGVNARKRGVFLPARSETEQPQLLWTVYGGTAHGRIVRISGSGLNWKDPDRWVDVANSVLVGSWTSTPAETPSPSVTPTLS